ncbi:MAG: hypothetical protein AB7K24_11610 [Gemmataceae bacterium]
MRPFIVFAIILLAAGCFTHLDRLYEIRSDYYAGDMGMAHERIEKYTRKWSRDADVLALDRALVLLCEGKIAQAEQELRGVRDRFDALEGVHVVDGALAMVTDDQRLPYAGEDYEKILLRAFLTLTSLLGDGQDARAYALQVADKQEQIIQSEPEADGKNPRANYQRIALGAYLFGIEREATHVHYDDAVRAFQQVFDWEPDYEFAAQDLERVSVGRHSAPGNGVVHIFTLVGRGPYKEEKVEIPTTVALLVADRVLSATGKHTLPPTVAPIKVPCVVMPPNEVDTVNITVDGAVWGETATIADIGKLATQQAEALHDYTLGRAIARRVIKKSVVYGVKDVVGAEGAASLLFDIGGVIWEAAESADTRCWGLLPAKIEVRRIELPAGEHTIGLQPITGSGSPCGARESARIEVRDGRNTYLLANFPSGRLVGRIMTNTP